jgi:hypothetical protein
VAAVSLGEGDVEAALARERGLWEAYRTNDRARLELLIDPLALDVGPRGPRSRDQILGALARVRVDAYTIEEFKVVDFDPVAVVVYRSRIDGAHRGVPFRYREVYVTSVWRLGDGTWRLIHRCESPALTV